MKRHELADEDWELIKDLFPSSAGKRGRQWKDHRQMINGIFWILNTGAPWRDLPERYGAWQTVYDRFNRMRREGFLDKMLERLQMRLDEEGQIDWDLWCIDGSNIRAGRAAAGAKKKGRVMNLTITHLGDPEVAGEQNCTSFAMEREPR